uniref:Genome polyprotein n=1 Tax=Neopomacentrus bankieri picornavirus TaxID=2951498 RepID=A0A9Y1D5Y5_9PICO|nr:MAG: polyprotein [Neopomacentrus bankieri picornavirus]
MAQSRNFFGSYLYSSLPHCSVCDPNWPKYFDTDPEVVVFKIERKVKNRRPVEPTDLNPPKPKRRRILLPTGFSLTEPFCTPRQIRRCVGDFSIAGDNTTDHYGISPPMSIHQSERMISVMNNAEACGVRYVVDETELNVQLKFDPPPHMYHLRPVPRDDEFQNWIYENAHFIPLEGRCLRGLSPGWIKSEFRRVNYFPDEQWEYTIPWWPNHFRDPNFQQSVARVAEYSAHQGVSYSVQGNNNSFSTSNGVVGNSAAANVPIESSVSGQMTSAPHETGNVPYPTPPPSSSGPSETVKVKQTKEKVTKKSRPTVEHMMSSGGPINDLINNGFKYGSHYLDKYLDHKIGSSTTAESQRSKAGRNKDGAAAVQATQTLTGGNADPAFETTNLESDRVATAITIGNTAIGTQMNHSGATTYSEHEILPVPSNDAVTVSLPSSSRIFPPLNIEWPQSVTNWEVLLQTSPLSILFQTENVFVNTTRQHQYLQTGYKVTVTVNATRFNQGLLGVFALPGPAYADSLGPMYLTNPSLYFTAIHGLINLAETDTVTLDLPFCSFKPAFDWRSYQDWNIIVAPIVALSGGASAPTTLIVEVTVAPVDTVWSGLRMYDSVSKPIVAVYQSIKQPPTPTGKGVKAQHITTRGVPGNGAFSNVILGQEIGLALTGDGATPIPTTGEMTDWLEIAHVSGELTNWEWAVSYGVGDLIGMIAAGPFSAGLTTPLGFTATLFSQWTGSLNLRLFSITSQQHYGRYVVCYTPGEIRPQTMYEAMQGPYTVITIGLDRVGEFIIPYISDSPWQATTSFTGFVTVWVYNPLVAPVGTAQTTQIAVFLSAGLDFDLRLPISPLPLFQSNETPADTNTEATSVAPGPIIDQMTDVTPMPRRPAVSDTNLAFFMSMYRTVIPTMLLAQDKVNVVPLTPDFTSSQPSPPKDGVFPLVHMIMAAFGFVRGDLRVRTFMESTNYGTGIECRICFIPPGASTPVTKQGMMSYPCVDVVLTSQDRAPTFTIPFSSPYPYVSINIPPKATSQPSGSAFSVKTLNNDPILSFGNIGIYLSSSVNLTMDLAYSNFRGFCPRSPPIGFPSPSGAMAMKIEPVNLKDPTLYLKDQHICRGGSYVGFDGEKFKTGKCTFPRKDHTEVSDHVWTHITHMSQFAIPKTNPDTFFQTLIGDDVIEPMPELENDIKPQGLSDSEESDEEEPETLWTKITNKLPSLGPSSKSIDKLSHSLVKGAQEVGKASHSMDQLRKTIAEITQNVHPLFSILTKFLAVVAAWLKHSFTEAVGLFGILFAPELVGMVLGQDNWKLAFAKVFGLRASDFEELKEALEPAPHAPLTNVNQCLQLIRYAMDLPSKLIGCLTWCVEKLCGRASPAEVFYEAVQRVRGARKAAVTSRDPESIKQYLGQASALHAKLLKECCNLPGYIGFALNSINHAEKLHEAYVRGDKPALRIEPIVVMIHGDPGCGKSFITTALANHLCEIHDKDPNENVFTKSASNKFYDGYKGQLVHIIDDLGQDPDGEDFDEFCNIVSTTQYQPALASIGEKGIPYSSTYILIPTNFSEPNEKAARCLNAVRRRIHIKVHMKVNRAYSTKTTLGGKTWDRINIGLATKANNNTNIPPYALASCPLFDGYAAQWIDDTNTEMGYWDLLTKIVDTFNKRNDVLQGANNLFKRPYKVSKMPSVSTKVYKADHQGKTEFTLEDPDSPAKMKRLIRKEFERTVGEDETFPCFICESEDVCVHSVNRGDWKCPVCYGVEECECEIPNYTKTVEPFNSNRELLKEKIKAPEQPEETWLGIVRKVLTFLCNFLISFAATGLIATGLSKVVGKDTVLNAHKKYVYPYLPKKLQEINEPYYPEPIPPPIVPEDMQWTPPAPDEQSAYGHIPARRTTHQLKKREAEHQGAKNPEQSGVIGVVKKNLTALDAGTTGIWISGKLLLMNWHVFADERDKYDGIRFDNKINQFDSYFRDADLVIIHFPKVNNRRDLTRYLPKDPLDLYPSDQVVGLCATPVMLVSHQSPEYCTCTASETLGRPVIKTRACSFPGMCGSALVKLGKARDQIIGLHTAGVAGLTAMAEILTASRINWMIGKLCLNVLPQGVVVDVKPAEKPVYIVRKTTLSPSPAFGAFPLKKEPAVLSKYDPRLAVEVDNLEEKLMSKFCNDVQEWPEMRLAFEMWKNQAVIPKCKPLTLHEALNGIPGLEPLDMKQSVGYPFNTMGMTRDHFLWKDEDGVIHPKEALLRELENFWINLKDEKFSTFLKDELRPVVKVMSGNTRLVENGPLLPLIMFRKLFGRFYAEVHSRHDLLLGIAVGCDPDLDWTEYGQGFSRYQLVHDVDYKNFDGSIPKCLFTLLAENWHVFSTDPDAQKLLEWASQTKRVMGDKEYEVSGSMPSGMSGTSIWNSICNNVLLLSAFINSPVEVKEFNILTYGDDALYATKPNVPIQHVQSFLASIGFTITPANKGEEFVDGGITEAVFLKRAFKPHPFFPSMYIPAIELDTVEQSVMWERDGNLQETIDSLAQLTWQHGKDYYDWWATQIKLAVVKCGHPPPKFPLWGELHCNWQKKVIGGFRTGQTF